MIDTVYLSPTRLYITLTDRSSFSVDFAISPSLGRATQRDRLYWDLDESKTALVWSTPALVERLDLTMMLSHSSVRIGDVPPV